MAVTWECGGGRFLPQGVVAVRRIDRMPANGKMPMRRRDAAKEKMGVVNVGMTLF